MTPTALLLVDEAAELVGVSARTVARWVRAGLLTPYAHQGRAALYLDSDVFEAERAARTARRADGCPTPVS